VIDVDDPLSNTSYTYEWEFVLPPDVTVPPVILDGCGADDAMCRFAAPSCDTNGLSQTGFAHTVRVIVTGADHGNSGGGEADFGVCLLGDVNHNGTVNVVDRAIVNAFWRLGSAGTFTSHDCDVNGDGTVDVADRSIVNGVWRGEMCDNSVGSTCPLCSATPPPRTWELKIGN
jgi:hypothetical protein